ncbi:hypothetical protein vBEcoMWL3_gp246c [Escherichia phage vB_EcoM_WL-3]|nr:hypothetical protein vBEcoMWL3_gp246c [Escherichia phage vB_EcoM_WL-3]UGO55627.1 hypothetical protein JLBYU24_260 [Escherichia phage JLBYU24]
MIILSPPASRPSSALNFLLISAILPGSYCVFNNKYLYLFTLRFGWYIIEISLIERGSYGFRNDAG